MYVYCIYTMNAHIPGFNKKLTEMYMFLFYKFDHIS